MIDWPTVIAVALVVAGVGAVVWWVRAAWREFFDLGLKNHNHDDE